VIANLGQLGVHDLGAPHEVLLGPDVIETVEPSP